MNCIIKKEKEMQNTKIWKENCEESIGLFKSCESFRSLQPPNHTLVYINNI